MSGRGPAPQDLPFPVVGETGTLLQLVALANLRLSSISPLEQVAVLALQGGG